MDEGWRIRDDLLHGRQEVIGSTPIFSTTTERPDFRVYSLVYDGSAVTLTIHTARPMLQIYHSPLRIRAYDARGDVNKTWYIEITDLRATRRKYHKGGMNSIEDPEARTAMLTELFAEYCRMAASGWIPKTRNKNKGGFLLLVTEEFLRLKSPPLRPDTAKI